MALSNIYTVCSSLRCAGLQIITYCLSTLVTVRLLDSYGGYGAFRCVLPTHFLLRCVVYCLRPTLDGSPQEKQISDVEVTPGGSSGARSSTVVGPSAFSVSDTNQGVQSAVYSETLYCSDESEVVMRLVVRDALTLCWGFRRVIQLRTMRVVL